MATEHEPINGEVTVRDFCDVLKDFLTTARVSA